MSLFELAGDDTDDDTCKTFVFEGENHSLGNALRSIISRYSETTFCGYSIPHPSENKIVFRIQTNGPKSVNILERGLTDLKLLCNHIVLTFENAVEDFKTKQIDDLSDDCLQHIFSFLPIQDLIRVERVSKRWQLTSRKAWRTITVDLKKLNSDNAKQIVQKCGCECVDLHILGITFHTSIFNDINKYCKSLIRLKVLGPSVPNCCFNFTSYPFMLKLQHYDVHQYRSQQLLPTGYNSITDFLKNGTKLQTFRYRRGTEEIYIENSGQKIELKKIEINLSTLFEIFEVKELTLRDLPSKTKSGVVLFSLGLLPSNLTSLTIMNMIQFEKGFENLKCHALQNVCFFSCKDVEDNIIKAISLKCSALKSLRVEDCPKISLRCVSEIKARSNHIIVSFENVADIWKRKTIDDLSWNCLEYIFSFLPIQDLIRIERVSKKWQRLCRNAWRTVTINLSNLKRDFTENIVRKCGLECKDLSILGLASDSRASYAIDEYCKVLTRLKIWGLILPDIWLEFSSHPFMLNLTHYDIHHGFFLPKTSSLITNFLKNATKLQSFRYRGAEDEIRVEYSGRFVELKNIEIDLNALFEVFEVKELILRDMPVKPKSDVDPFSLGLLPSGITSLTIMNMSQFAKGCKNLKCRALQDVSFISCDMEDYIIEAFKQQCLALKSIRVEDCPKISS